MNAYFYYFYNFMRSIFDHLYNVVIAIKDCILGILDIQFYQNLFNSYYADLSPLGWVAYILTHILIYVLIGLLLYLMWKGIKVLFTFKVDVVKYEQMKDEIVTLKREVMKANYEKDKILAMRISELGMEVHEELLNAGLEGIPSEKAEDANTVGNMELETASTVESQEQSDSLETSQFDSTSETSGEKNEVYDEKKVEKVKVGELRFPRLSSVDRVYLASDYVAPEYNKTISLEEVCINFRNFAASKLHLYYDLEVIKQTFAVFGSAKMLILQGISGTGKTSLPYALGQYLSDSALDAALNQ